METVFLDTETTGLDDNAELVEIAIVDEKGQVIFESYCKPTVPVDPEAQAVHGIGADDLAGAPAWPAIAAQVEAALTGRQVVIFNADFDTRILRSTAAAHGDPAPWLDQLNVTCAMYQAAYIYGATNDFGTISLANAALEAGVEFVGRAHSAAGDAATTALLWQAMARVERRRETDRKRRAQKKADLSKQDAKPNRLSPSERRAVEGLRNYVAALQAINMPCLPAEIRGTLAKMGFTPYKMINVDGAARVIEVLEAILAGKTASFSDDEESLFAGLGFRLNHTPHTQVAQTKRGKGAAFTARVDFDHPNRYVAGKEYRCFMPWQVKEYKPKPK